MSDRSDSQNQSFSPSRRPLLSPSQSEDEFEWESDTEQLSFVQSSPIYHHPDQPPLVFGATGDNHPTSVWPPRQLSSTDFHYLESCGLSAQQDLPPVGESNEVFCSSPGRNLVNMPGEEDLVQDLIKIFNRTVRNWT